MLYHISYSVGPIPQVSGYRIFFIVSIAMVWISPDPERAVRGPDTATSMFKYAMADETSQGRCVSTHSVDPWSPNSSASHEPKILWFA